MLSLLSPIKLNLFLKIIRKRPDGYHELASLFQAMDFGDRMFFKESSEDKLTCTGLDMPLDSTNLITKAISLFRKNSGSSQHYHIHVEKKIPMEAGLGGGSSNAATTLWALNQLTGKGFQDQELAQWGAELGSDVSFFLSHGTAYCTGRGEIIQNVSFLPPSSPMTIIKPPYGLSTPAVYKALQIEKLPNNCPLSALKTFESANPHFFNDLEQSAFRISEPLKQLQQNLLKSGFSTVTLAGSGSSLFCIGNGHFAAPADYFFVKTSPVRRSSNSWYFA